MQSHSTPGAGGGPHSSLTPHLCPARVAWREGRIILTLGLPYHTVKTVRTRPRLPQAVGEEAPAQRSIFAAPGPGQAGCCFPVDCSLKAQQQAKAVLRHFRVCVAHTDIFSCCMMGPVYPGATWRATRGPLEVGEDRHGPGLWWAQGLETFELLPQKWCHGVIATHPYSLPPSHDTHVKGAVGTVARGSQDNRRQNSSQTCRCLGLRSGPRLQASQGNLQKLGFLNVVSRASGGCGPLGHA